jgi:uncharacterized protein (DUF1330 family)
MKAYLIVVETVHDEAMFAEYRKQVVDTLVPFGGRFIARGGKLTMLEGDWQHPRTAIIEFPRRESAEAWYSSPDYQKIIGLRLKSTSGSLVILDGIDGEEPAAELERIRADLAEHAGERPDLQRCLSVMDLHMRAAWILIALGRYDEAITSAGEANRARRASIAFAPESPYGGTVLWQACEARAVAHLARGQWSEAEQAAREALADFEEQDGNYRLYELALQAQGRLHPDRVYKVSKDPARELAEFDARRYALVRSLKREA